MRINTIILFKNPQNKQNTIHIIICIFSEVYISNKRSHLFTISTNGAHVQFKHDDAGKLNEGADEFDLIGLHKDSY